jgi:predicted RecB family nuclease
MFNAFLKCPTKCWRRAGGEAASGNAYAEWVKSQNASYRATEIERLLSETPRGEVAISPPPENLKAAKWHLAANLAAHARMNSCVLESEVHAVERVPSEGRGRPSQYIPIRFMFTNKLGEGDKLLLAFDTFVLSQVTGREISFGKIIHGDDHSALKVKTAALSGEVRKSIERIAALLSSPTPPDLVLNRHCGECEFRTCCRQKAIEADDLILLSGMSEKERKKLRSKGIFTVTQLSYTFRPRRRPKRMRDKREKYHHSLKALAIRENKIHIVGTPELKIEGMPIYLDVEGLPDRDFYYLIGVRIGSGDSAVHRSLWADTAADEGKIWREFLGVLETAEKPVLIHYGSYETTFLKRMGERHGKPPEGAVAGKTIQGALNLLSGMYAQSYFPTYANGLKDVARFLGFNWSATDASGLQSILWRHAWENSGEPALKQHVILYNREDCEGLAQVAETLAALGTTAHGVDSADSKIVSVESITTQQTMWPKFSSPIAAFEQINKAARWDYQRDRVYVRTSKRIRRIAAHKGTARKASHRKLKVIMYPEQPACPDCQQQGVPRPQPKLKILRDIHFGRGSLRSRVVAYRYRIFWCPNCQVRFGYPKEFWPGSKYGRNLVTYVVYHIVKLCIPREVVGASLNRLLDLGLTPAAAHNMKITAAEYYEESRRAILLNLAAGSLLHVDETRVSIEGKAAYVWVLTDLHEVAYVYSDTREGEFVQTLLHEFKGVLVSDFYAVYDSLDCPQQKCLIHLIRDLNAEILAQPYDEELKTLVRGFAELLRSMVETVDRFGLKKHFLRKHLVSVERFYQNLSKSDCQSEAAIKCKDRFEKNRNKLFTFLRHDGVPWNNNNAEHAIKAFARLRDVIRGHCTAEAVEQYLVLLSVCETCEYQGIDFLDFLRSGVKDIHAFAPSRGGQRSRSGSDR